MAEPEIPPDHPLERQAVLEAFGKAPRDAELTSIERPTGWRARGAAMRLGGAILITPVVALIPPHAPWVAAALIGGIVFARRRWTEKLTVVSFVGTCPRCDAPLALAKGTRLLAPHVLTCEGCHHSVTLRHAPR